MKLKPLLGGLVVLALAAAAGRAQFTWIGASAVSGDIILSANWKETQPITTILLGGNAITFGDATQAAVWMDASELTTVLGTSNVTFGSLTFSSTTAAYSFAGVNSPTITLNGDITTTAANSNRVNFNSTVGLILASGSHTITPVSGSGVIIASPISGSGAALAKSGAGGLYLSGANTYTGGTTLNAGLLAVTNTTGSGTGTGTITINGGTLYIGYFTANGSIAGNIVMNTDGSAVADFSRTTPYTYAGTITGSGGLVAEGGSTLTLSGVNTFSGYTGLLGGTLADGVAGAFSPNSPMSFHTGSSLSVNYNETIPALESYTAGAGTTTIAGGVTLTLDSAGSFAYSGVITGAGALVKAGTGTETLTGANTFTGTTTINGGTVAIGADSGLGAAPASATPGQLSLNGGTLQSSGTFTLASNRGINLGAGGGAFNTDAATTLTYGGIIAGSGQLTKLGAGTLALSGVNTYSGGTTITDGILFAGNGSSLGAGSVTLNGGQLSLGSGVTFTNPLAFGVSGGVLGGLGTFGSAVSVGGNVAIAPGNSPGTLTFSSGLTFAPAGTYDWEIESVTGTPGQPTTWDLISVTGALTVTATSATPFTIRILSLDPQGMPGLVNTFESGAGYTWTIATATGGITGFDPSAFLLDTSGFQNPLGIGYFFVTADATNLMLNFTPVPEPSTYALMAVGLAVLLYSRRRLRRR